MLQIV
jgi:hypothetical protein